MDELQKSYVKTQSIPLNVDPDDVYMHTIPITKFLVLFKKTFDYKTTIAEYLKQFGEISQITQKIIKISKVTHQKKLVFNTMTVEGQLRSRQLQKADMYNKQVYKALTQLMEICCGSFYLPDMYFTRPYENLPQEIKDILTIRLMRNKLKCPLYELIGAGESVDYLTFEIQTYNVYVKEIKEQFAKTKTWEPFKFFEKALAYKKQNNRVKGVNPVYRRCGYEQLLMNNVECVLLYFIMVLIIKKDLKESSLEFTGTEFVVFKDKIQDCLINFRQFQKEVENDQLWIAVKEFVAKRTGGVKVVKVTYDDEGNEIEDPNAPPKERRRIYDRFEYQGYGVCYGTGQIFRSGELEPEPEIYEEPGNGAEQSPA